MIIILYIAFILTGIIVLYWGQYENSSRFEQPLIFHSQFFTFISTICSLLFIVFGYFVIKEGLGTFFVLLVLLFTLNSIRKTRF